MISNGEDFILFIILIQRSDKGFDSGKKTLVGYLYKKSMQMDLVQYKVLHITSELIRNEFVFQSMS